MTLADVGALTAYIDGSSGDVTDTARRLMNQVLLVGSQVDISTARELPCDTALADRIDIAGEVDSFTFNVTGNQEIAHLAARPDGFGAISWQLLDANGTPVACTPTTVFSRDCGPLSDAGNPYVVQVRSTAGLPSYRIHLQRLTDGAVCSPKELICNTPASDTIESLADTDLLRFDGISGERVHVSVSGGFLGFLPFWRLLDPLGRQMACEGVVSFASGERDCDLPVDGKYGIEVMDDNLGATGTFSIQLQRLTAGRTCGVGITCNVPIRDAVNARIEALADTDLFTFDGVTGERVHITLEFGTTGFFPMWRALDPSGKEVACSGVATFAKGGRDCTIPTNGTYAIEVIDDGMNAIGQYSVHLQRLTEGRTCGVPITCNTPFSDPAATRVEAGADSDLFTFTGIAGERIHASLMIPPASLGFTPQWRVLDPAGGEVACELTSGFGGGRRGCDLPVNGRHSVEVMDPDTFGIGTYTLLVECAGAPPIPTLPLNDPRTITLQRDTPLMFDILVPIGAPDLFVTLQKYTLWSGTVTLRSGNGQVVASSTILADVLLHVPQPAPGPYRLELTGAGTGVLAARTALPTLTFGQTVIGTILRQWGSAWYQLDVPPSQSQLSVAVETLGFLSRLELYFGRFGVPPVRTANGDRISLEIPSPAAGRYYLHLTDSAEILGAAQSRDHQIVANNRTIEEPPTVSPVIASVSPTTGGVGRVTITIRGLALDQNAIVRLVHRDVPGSFVDAFAVKGTSDNKVLTASLDLRVRARISTHQ